MSVAGAVLLLSTAVYAGATSDGAVPSRCNDGLISCLKSDLVQAFDRIQSSASYRLLPGLSLDRKPGAADLSAPQTSATAGKDYSLEEVYRRAERVFNSHSLYWNLMPGVDLTVFSDKHGQFELGVTKCDHDEESRTFKFGMRRMKLVLLPIMYKLGVITTLLILLTVFALKGLTIGVLLLIMSTAGLVAKYKWVGHGGYGGTSGLGGKEVHVHVHGGGGPHGGLAGPAVYHHHGSSPWAEDWVREDKPGTYNPPQQLVAGTQDHHLVDHQNRLHHALHGMFQSSTASPWATYIGDWPPGAA